MNNLPSFKKRGVKLEKPKQKLIYAGNFCECGGPLYNFDDKIICKGCGHPKPKRKLV